MYNDHVTITYIKPEINPLQTTSGGQAPTFSTQVVTNRVNQVIPVFLSASVENSAPNRIEMTYSLSLTNVAPASSSFTVLVNSSQVPVNAVTITGAKVLLTIANRVNKGDIVTVAYVKPVSNPLHITSGGQAVSLNPQSVINNVTDSGEPPVIVVDYKGSSYSGFVYEIDASGSYDPDKDNLTYTWSVPSNVPVSSTKGSIIRYLGPSVGSAQIVDFTLNISDGRTTTSRIIPVEILPYKPELEAAEISNVEASSFQVPYFPYNIIDGNIGTMWSRSLTGMNTRCCSDRFGWMCRHPPRPTSR